METTLNNLPSIWSYLYYRVYLKAVYETKKRESKGRFSYRVFSQKTGVASPNYLKLIVDGARNLTASHARRIAAFCRLTREEKDYFLALMRWNQVKRKEDSIALWADVLRKRGAAKEMELSTAQLSILTQWHTIVLFEMLRLVPTLSIPEDFVRSLRKKISIEEVEESFQLLERAHVVEKTSTGYKVIQKTLQTTEDIPSKSIREFHKQIITQALEAIDTVELAQREYISTTISIRQSDLPRLKAHLREMRNLILSEADAVSEPEVVYQVNLQLFPLTHAPKETL